VPLPPLPNFEAAIIANGPDPLAVEAMAVVAAEESASGGYDGANDAAENIIDMATKLDLAVAYQEIGEHVGARVLLEEVIQGGTTIQADKARAMLKKLLKEIDWQ
jgi:pilus assembly protein FimV